ncbi:MAG: hypothetical protein QE283_07520 [Rhodoferax sp.]|nr:hypothetical protein [Rhodoferax sp.]
MVNVPESRHFKPGHPLDRWAHAQLSPLGRGVSTAALRMARVSDLGGLCATLGASALPSLRDACGSGPALCQRQLEGMAV